MLGALIRVTVVVQFAVLDLSGLPVIAVRGPSQPVHPRHHHSDLNVRGRVGAGVWTEDKADDGPRGRALVEVRGRRG